jgi:argininosuccinate lyase
MVARKLKTVDINTDANVHNDNIASKVIQVEGMASPLWGGHFSRGINESIQKIISTSNFDKRFYGVAVESLKAQMKMHIKRNVIPETYGRTIVDALDTIKKEVIDGKFVFDENAKNIYENISMRLKQLAGNAVEWLTVARASSNQTTGDFKLWVRDAYDTLDSSIQNLQAALIDKAEENVKTIFPGNAHSQLTQPVSFGHHLMAYVEMFARDRSRVKDNRKRMNESPFASGEMVGNAYNLSREMVARMLGFDKACNNSIDAINDRDYVVDFLAFASNCAIHLSRLAGELITWHSTHNDYISFSNAFVSQSQVLPYRRDPEALEGIRGKAGKVLGALMGAVADLKNLPLSNTSDYNELCELVTESYDTLLNSLSAMSAIIADFTINRKQMKEAASSSFSTAIDLVDWLIQSAGLSPSKAMEKSRLIIEYAINKGKKLSLLELDEIKAIEPKANDDIYSVLIPSRAMISRRSGNGSNPVQIRKAIRAARRNHL